MLISFTRRSVYLRDSSAPREDLLTGLPQTSSANPFSSRFVRPGSIAYRFSGDWDEATVGGQLLQWSTRNFAASIVGPHGTGKSTLLHTLAPYLATAGYELLWFRLSQADRGGAAHRQAILRAVAEMWGSVDHRSRGRCIIVDGFEQLDWFARVRIATRLCWSTRNPNRFGSYDRPRDFLLVTAHAAPVGIQTFFRTEWRDSLVEELTLEKLCQLSLDERAAMIRSARHRASLLYKAPEHDRNVRDYWFSLYDDYERLRRERRYNVVAPEWAAAARRWTQ